VAQLLPDAELAWLEQVAARAHFDDVEPSEEEQLRMIEIETSARRRMLAGDPMVGERCRS
jgi:hypothetical protein